MTQTSRVVAVTFAGGTDSGSGIGSIVLQRSGATYSTANGCGTQGTFATIATNPTSIYSDTTAAKGCYTCQLLVTDKVGNPVTYTSGSRVKVTQ